MSSMLLGLFVVMTLGVLLLTFVTSIINLLWTCIMTSYSISLPGLIWGGGAFNFPDFIPRTASSPMNYYYWFFVVAVIIIVVSFAINAFRHLAVWGKFDENQAYEGTNFWHQFKWVLILIFMTILTPVVIWICYSILMLGVYFFVNLAGNNVMFLTITDGQYASLKTQVCDDLLKIINMNPTEVQSFINGMISGKTDELMIDEIMSIIGETATANQAAQILQNLKTLASSDSISKINQLQQACVQMYLAVKIGTFVSPLSTTSLDLFYTKVSSILNETSMGLNTTTMTWHGENITVVQYSFFQSWEYIFGNWTPDSNFNIEKLANKFYPESTPSIVKNWKSGTGIFSLLGYGQLDTVMTEWISKQGIAYSTPAIYKLLGLAPYTIDGNDFDTYFLTFIKGQETGIKTCPLIRYIMGIFGRQSAVTWATFKLTLYARLGLTAKGLYMVVQGEILEKQTVWGTTIGTAPAIALETSGLIMFFAAGVTLFIQVVLFIAAAKMLLSPLLGLVIFLWSSFFEAMWYFFLLLPAIGASVLDNGQKIYMTTWKHCLGKMAASLVTWAALLMFFVALLQINNFYTSILNALKGSSEQWTDLIDIKVLLPNLQIGESLGIGLFVIGTIGISISISGIIKFLLAMICLIASTELIQKIGSLAFGQEVYGNVAQKIGQPLNAIVPGFGQAVASITQAGKQFGSATIKGAQKTSDLKGAQIKGAKEQQIRQQESEKQAKTQAMLDNKNELMSKQRDYQTELNSGKLSKNQQAVVQAKLNAVENDLKNIDLNEKYLNYFGSNPNEPTAALTEMQSEELFKYEANKIYKKKYDISEKVIQREQKRLADIEQEKAKPYVDLEDL